MAEPESKVATLAARPCKLGEILARVHADMTAPADSPDQSVLLLGAGLVNAVCETYGRSGTSTPVEDTLRGFLRIRDLSIFRVFPCTYCAIARFDITGHAVERVRRGFVTRCEHCTPLEHEKTDVVERYNGAWIGAADMLATVNIKTALADTCPHECDKHGRSVLVYQPPSLCLRHIDETAIPCDIIAITREMRERARDTLRSVCSRVTTASTFDVFAPLVDLLERLVEPTDAPYSVELF
jgi:hypothetical protein